MIPSARVQVRHQRRRVHMEHVSVERVLDLCGAVEEFLDLDPETWLTRPEWRAAVRAIREPKPRQERAGNPVHLTAVPVRTPQPPAHRRSKAARIAAFRLRKTSSTVSPKVGAAPDRATRIATARARKAR